MQRTITNKLLALTFSLAVFGGCFRLVDAFNHFSTPEDQGPKSVATIHNRSRTYAISWLPCYAQQEPCSIGAPYINITTDDCTNLSPVQHPNSSLYVTAGWTKVLLFASPDCTYGTEVAPVQGADCVDLHDGLSLMPLVVNGSYGQFSRNMSCELINAAANLPTSATPCSLQAACVYASERCVFSANPSESSWAFGYCYDAMSGAHVCWPDAAYSAPPLCSADETCFVSFEGEASSCCQPGTMPGSANFSVCTTNCSVVASRAWINSSSSGVSACGAIGSCAVCPGITSACYNITDATCCGESVCTLPNQCLDGWGPCCPPGETSSNDGHCTKDCSKAKPSPDSCGVLEQCVFCGSWCCESQNCCNGERCCGSNQTCNSYSGWCCDGRDQLPCGTSAGCCKPTETCCGDPYGQSWCCPANQSCIESNYGCG